MSRPNPRIAEPLRQALLGNDLFEAEPILDELSLLHMPGKSGFSGPYQGKEAILELFAYLAQLTNGTLRFTASRVLSERAPVMVVCGRKTATREDRQLDTDAMHIFSLRDRVVREMWTFHEDQGSMDEFWTA